jgi:hypothetical protein
MARLKEILRNTIQIFDERPRPAPSTQLLLQEEQITAKVSQRIFFSKEIDIGRST